MKDILVPTCQDCRTPRRSGATRRRLLALAAAGALAFATHANAALLTSDAGYSGPTLDLSAFATGNYNFTFGPESIPGGITFTSNVINSNSGLGSVLGQGGYGLAANGSFGGDAVYAGLDGPSGYMSFLFDTAVSSFGAYINYAPGLGEDQKIGAYDSGGNLLEEWNLTVSAPISTPGGFNEFAFRGIQLATASIAEFRMSGAYILAAASADGSATPPPPVGVPDSGATIAMLGLAIVSLAAFRKKSRA
jgi:hypothetical protein